MTDEVKKEERSLNFLEEIIEADLATGKYKSIVTRFPPEPKFKQMLEAWPICR